jgi:beta-phosphoglucomutase
MLEAALFDWDGTLADTRNAIVISFQKALKENGLDASTEYVERRIGIGAAETFRDILRLKSLPLDEALVKRLVYRKSEIQIDLAGEVQLFEGARELLEALQGKVKVALASMNSFLVIGHLLKVTKLEKYFQVVVTVDRIRHSKPHPEIFLKTAKELHVNPGHCVVFEDSIFGVKAAKSAGMCCIAVTTGVYSVGELEKEKPDLVIKSLKDPKIISFIMEK